MEVEKEEDQEGGIRSNSRFRYKTPCTHTHAHVHAYIRTLWLPALLAANTHMHTGICMHTRIHTGMHAYMV